MTKPTPPKRPHVKRDPLGRDLPPIEGLLHPATQLVRANLPNWLLADFEPHVIKEYGLRGLSRWVDEAIIQLVQYPMWNELLYSMPPAHYNQLRTYSLTPRGSAALDAAIITIRKGAPLAEGVRTGVVYTAIAQRLLRAGA